MKIAHLADHQQFIPALSRWFLDEWSEYFGDKTSEDISAMFRARLNHRCVPLALVAFDGNQPFGTVALVEESIATHKHLSPWLAGLYVAPQWRHQGVATGLIDAAVNEARAIKIETLYVAILKAEEYYKERGWKTIDKIVHNDEPITIMRLDLSLKRIGLS
jgi:predicted N-acetyltransferase YhbS